MAKLISKESKKFQCYSERGILSYYIFRYLPYGENFKEFLGKLKFPDGVKNPFEGASITEESFFSELDLGKSNGFGSPDGAIYFKANRTAYLIFIEGKINGSYEKSCTGEKRYNSTIKGQIEIRWRAASLYKLYTSEEVEIKQKHEYLTETPGYANFYGKRGQDEFYNDKRGENGEIVKFRRVKLINGVGDFFKKFVNNCKIENIYFLTITKDNENPFNKKGFEENLAPRLFKDGENKWKEFKGQFCWLPSEEIEGKDLSNNK